MDNIALALLFYVSGAVLRTVYGYLTKIVTSDEPTLQFNAKYWASMVMSIIASLMLALGTFSLVLPPGINTVAVFLMSFPAGYAINDAVNRGINLIQTPPSTKSADQTTNQTNTTPTATTPETPEP